MSTPEINPAPEQPANAGCAEMAGYAAEVVTAVNAYDAALKVKTDYWIMHVCGFNPARIPNEVDINHANEMAAHRALGRLLDAARLFAKHSDQNPSAPV